MNDQARSPSRSRIKRKPDNRIASGFDRIILLEFDFLEEHRTFVASHLSAQMKSFEENFALDLANMDDDQKRDYSDFVSDEYTKIFEVLPRLQWHAQFLVVYSTFEHSLHELCNIVKNKSGFSLSFKDLEGQGINRSANYLRKVAGVHSPFSAPEWQRASLLAEIRNVVAHRNGEIPLHGNDLVRRIENMAGVTLKQLVEGLDHVDLILSSEFVRDAIVDLRKMLTKIANYPLYEESNI